MVETETADVAVVGGGLAGLTAATYLARAGRRVTLFEKSRSIGGRAMTQVEDGFHFNLGPHALYRGGHGVAVLRELGVPVRGGTPKASGGYAIDGTRKHTLPGGFVSLLSTGLFGLSAKLETARLLGSMQKIDAAPIQDTSVRAWLDRAIRQPDVRRLVQALFRVATYANDPDRQSAGSAVAQLQMALSSGVTYLDGGWQTLIDGLRAAAVAAGVQIGDGTKSVAIEHDESVRAVRLADGRTLSAAQVIVAAGPDDAAALVPRSAALRTWAASAIPVQAACLDIALRKLPQPRALFGLGIDRPWYFSVHSAVAQLAPDGAAMIHVAKYLQPSTAADAKADERELEGVLDLLQPGWRALLVRRRFLPNMLVCNGLATAAGGGVAGRPSPAVPDVKNLYVVGDWVGRDGLLADASFASARTAAALALRAPSPRAAAA